MAYAMSDLQMKDPEQATRSDAPQSAYLGAALVIASRLVAEAQPTPNGVTWETDDVVGDVDNHTLARRQCRLDLYGGVAGIAWFLGHVAGHDPSGQAGAIAFQGFQFALAEASKTARSEPSLLSGS